MLNSHAENTYYHIRPVAEASVQEKMAFLKKVYGLLTASMVSATVGSLIGIQLAPILSRMGFLTIILWLGSFFFLKYAERKPGLNMVGLFTFTTLSGLMIGPMLMMYISAGMGMVVVQALALTAVTFFGLTGYVIFSKKDFSFMSGFLTVGIIILIVGGLINLFVQSSMMHFVFSGLGVFLFSGFILYDTSNIMRRHDTSGYVDATVCLFLDVFNLFVHLLSLLGILNRD